MQASNSSKQLVLNFHSIHLFKSDFTNWFSFFLWVTHGFSFSADYSELSFTPLICVQCFDARLIVPELLIFNKLSCLITISASIFKQDC